MSNLNIEFEEAKILVNKLRNEPDNDTKLKEAMASKDAHVMKPDTMTFEKKTDQQGRTRLEIKYYDLDAQFLSEIFYFNSESDSKVFYYNFVRMHHKRPEISLEISTIEEAILHQKKFRLPLYIIARKQKHFWKIREKIFI